MWNPSSYLLPHLYPLWPSLLTIIHNLDFTLSHRSTSSSLVTTTSSFPLLTVTPTTCFSLAMITTNQWEFDLLHLFVPHSLISGQLGSTIALHTNLVLFNPALLLDHHHYQYHYHHQWWFINIKKLFSCSWFNPDPHLPMFILTAVFSAHFPMCHLNNQCFVFKMEPSFKTMTSTISLFNWSVFVFSWCREIHPELSLFVVFVLIHI